MNNKFLDLLGQNKPLLADGATGTNLFEMGLQTGDSPELWNIDEPDKITKLYQSFIDAGSDIILTNTFGGTHYRLALHKAGDRVDELNQAAVKLARACADKAERDVVVAGSMGPTGEILEPNGTVSIDLARQAFSEQAAALKAGGVDVLWIETISSAEEIEAAVLAASEHDLPIVCTVSIDTNGRTMMGLTAEDTINCCAGLDATVTAVGTNCGVGASEVIAAVKNLATAADKQETRPALVAKANCGIPEWVDGKIQYNGTPEIMAEYARLAIDAGANIIGGCCGTSPVHLRAMREAIDAHTAQPSPSLETIESSLGEISMGSKAQLTGDLSVQGGSASGRGARKSRRKRT